MKKLIISIIALFTFLPFTKATTYYVDAFQGSDTSNGLFQLPMTSPDGPLLTISAAISLATDGDTIIVGEGIYAEQLTISKSLVLLGIQAYNKADGNLRGSESVIYPQTVGISRGPSTNNVQIWVLANNVVIDGFTIDGNNPLLVSGENVYGVDVDISYGIVVQGAVNNVRVTNNILTNTFESFVYYWGGGGATSGHLVSDNYMFNGGYTAVQMEGDMFGSVSNNVISTMPTAILVTDYNVISTGNLYIQFNDIQSSLGGIEMHNLTNGGRYHLNNNLLQSQNVNPSYVGVQLTNTNENITLDISNNNIIGGNAGFLFSDCKTKHLKLLNDSINGADYGVVFSTLLPGPRSDTLTLEGVKIYNSNNTSVSVTSNDYVVNVRTSNTLLNGGLIGAAFAGNVKWIPLNCSFKNMTDFFIRLDSAASKKRPNYDIVATTCTFDGLTGPAINHANSFLLEDKIHHYLDDNSMGYINVKPLNIYVSLNDGNVKVTPALAKTFDGWNVHIKPVTSTESVNIAKNITIYTYGYTELASLTMNGAGKILTLVGDLNIGKTLTLTDGLIKSSLGNALRLRETAKSIGGSDRSYVDGILYAKGYGLSRDTLVFPIGKGSDYRPATLFIDYSASSGILDYSNELFNSALAFTSKPANIKNVSKMHYWYPQVYGSPSISSIAYKLNYSSTFSDDQVSDENNLRIVSENGGVLTNLGGKGTTIENGDILSTNNSTTLRKVTLANAYGGSNLVGSTGPVASFVVNNICHGNDLQVTSTSNDPYSSLVYYRWDFGDLSRTDDTMVAANGSYTYADTGTYTVQLAIRNVFGQTDTLYQTLIVADVPVVSFSYISNCYPAAVDFNGQASVGIGNIVSYDWLIDGTTFNVEDTSYAFMLPGSYDAKLIVTSSFGCKDSFYQTVLYDSLPAVKITPSGINFICEGDTLFLNSVNTHYKYEWSTGSTTNNTWKNTSGEVELKANSSNNCFAYDTIFVNVVPLPIVSAGNDTTIYTGTRAQFNATGATSYLWTPSTFLNDATIFNPICKPATKTTYYLVGTDDYGCEGYDSVTVDLKFPTTIQVPNLITPNGDGHNDVWDLSTVPGIDNSKVVIMDRWGSVIYESPATGYKHNWAGKRLDIEYPEGTYYYIIELYDFKETVKGALLLVR